MAALKEPVKIFIVQSLACFETPQQVADAVKQRFGLEIERQQCENYDPTKYAGRNLSKKLKDLFERTRTDFRENIEDIAIANKAFRLKELQGMYDDSGRNKRLKQNLLKQAFQETDGRVTRQEIDHTCHLIEDWEGIEFEEGEVVREQPYSEENATKLFHMGDLGWQIWGFVKSEAEKIQKEANQVKEDVLGKSENSTIGKPDTASSPTTKKSNAKRSTSK